MANTIPVSQLISNIALPILENQLKAAALVNREYEGEWERGMNKGYMPGQTISVPLPSRYSWRAGNLANPQGTTINTVPITLQMGGIDLQMTSIERTVSISREGEIALMVEPAMEAIANEVDRQLLDLMHYTTNNVIGTPGTIPNTQATVNAVWGNSNQRLNEGSVSTLNRAFIMSPGLFNGMTQGQVVAFNPSDDASKAYRTGQLVNAQGFVNAMDQNVAVHTNGTQAVTGLLVSGANQTGSSITTAATTGTITRGTKISFNTGLAVNAVNPQSRTSTGTLAQFVVTADVASGATSIPIYPPITPSGNFQNVTNSPDTGANIAIFGTASGSYVCNVAFQKDAFALAMVPLFSPKIGSVTKGGTVNGVQRISHKGFNMDIIEVIDYTSRNFFWRFDILYGIAALRPETAVIYAT